MDVERSGPQSAGGDQGQHPVPLRTADLEIVLEHDGLSVEQEDRQLRLLFQDLDHLIQELQEMEAHGLERGVPLPVPVRVRDEDGDHAVGADRPWCGHPLPGGDDVRGVDHIAPSPTWCH